MVDHKRSAVHGHVVSFVQQRCLKTLILLYLNFLTTLRWHVASVAAIALCDHCCQWHTNGRFGKPYTPPHENAAPLLTQLRFRRRRRVAHSVLPLRPMTSNMISRYVSSISLLCLYRLGREPLLREVCHRNAVESPIAAMIASLCLADLCIDMAHVNGKVLEFGFRFL